MAYTARERGQVRKRRRHGEFASAAVCDPHDIASGGDVFIAKQLGCVK
jgi:hypothetical protein